MILAADSQGPDQTAHAPKAPFRSMQLNLTVLQPTPPTFSL